MNWKFKVACCVGVIIPTLTLIQVPIFENGAGVLLAFASLLFFLLFFLESKQGKSKAEFYAVTLIMIAFFLMIGVTLFKF